MADDGRFADSDSHESFAALPPDDGSPAGTPAGDGEGTSPEDAGPRPDSSTDLTLVPGSTAWRRKMAAEPAEGDAVTGITAADAAAALDDDDEADAPVPRPSSSTDVTAIAGDTPPSAALPGGHEAATLHMGAAPPTPAPAAAPGDSSGDVRPGEVWNGDFEFIRLLGKGGMGAVYLGHQRSLDRRVAIKVLPEQLSRDENFRSRFGLEAKAVAKLSSPYVTQVYTAGQHGGHHYFVMEFIDGRDLSGRLRGGFRPDHATALDLVLQAARGLEAAHQHDIIHRDIKPGNMMVDENGRLKLMDFGLVKLTRGEQQDTSITMAGTVMGTASYLSPEQGMGEACDARTDIYALGVVFYELLTGRLPFVGKSPTAVIFKHIHDEPKPPQEIDPTIGEDYQAIVLKCLQKDPGDRYQAASELIRDLEAVRDGQAPRTALLTAHLRSGGTLVRSAGFTRERRRRRLVWLVVLLVILGGGAGAAWHWRGPLGNLATRLQGKDDGAVGIDTELAAARQALADGDLDRAAELVDRVRALGPLNTDWRKVAQRLDDAREDGPRASTGEELKRIRSLLGNGNTAEATGALDHLLPLELAEAHRQEAKELREKAVQLGDFLDLAEQALVAGNLDAAAQAYNNAQLVIANTMAKKGINLVSLCGAFDRVFADGDYAAAAERLDAIVAAKPDIRVITVRKNRLDAVAAVAAAREELRAGRLAEAHQQLLKATELDPRNGDLPELRKALDVGGREAALAIAIKDEDLARAGTLAAEIGQLDAARGAAAAKQVDTLKATLQARADEARRKAEAERARQEAERQRRATLTGRVAALAKVLAGDAPDLAAAGTELAALDGELPEDLRDDLPGLRAAYAQRRDEAGVRAVLAAVDAAVLAGDQGALAVAVSAAGHREALQAMMGQQGLTFAHRLVKLETTEAGTVAEVVLRTGMQLAPEQDFRYRYTVERKGDGWVVAAAAPIAPAE